MKFRAPLLPAGIRWLVVLGIGVFIFYNSIVTMELSSVRLDFL